MLVAALKAREYQLLCIFYVQTSPAVILNNNHEDNVLQHVSVYCAHTPLTVSCAGLISVRSAPIISRSSSALECLARGRRSEANSK